MRYIIGKKSKRKMSKKVIHDFTEGPLFGPMLRFSIPFMISNGLQVLYSMADMLIVGKFVGRHGISGVMTASQSVFFLTMVGMGFATGGQVLISQLIGRGERQRLRQAIGTQFSIILTAGIFFSTLSVLFSEPFLHLLETPDDAFQGARHYLLICGGGLIFIYGYNMIAAILRGVGDSVRPFKFIVVSSLMNVVLDLVFVGGFGWGVAGAGFATILSQAAAFLLALAYLYRNQEGFNFDFRPASFKVDPVMLKALVKLGIPFAVRFAAINISMLFVTSLVNSLGTATSAAYGIALRLDEFANKISQGVMMAVSTIVGQNIGAGHISRIRRGVYYAWGICGGFFLFFGLAQLLFPRQLYSIFTNDEEVLKLAPIIISALILHYPALLIMKGTNGFVQGIGNALFGLIIAILDGLVFRVTFSWLFGIYFNMGLYGMILGYALATYSTALPNLFYFLFIPWYKRKTVI
ncbi:MAG: MATE family efflux transporter [Lentisphaerae bacterium]|nr:MATE family efflux transporter [Lentisphaerota bacterium]